VLFMSSRSFAVLAKRTVPAGPASRIGRMTYL
jgi:hypothetical protein